MRSDLDGAMLRVLLRAGTDRPASNFQRVETAMETVQ